MKMDADLPKAATGPGTGEGGWTVAGARKFTKRQEERVRVKSGRGNKGRKMVVKKDGEAG